MEKGKKYKKIKLEPPLAIIDEMKKVYNTSYNERAKIIFNLSKRKLEVLHKLIGEIHKIKYRTKKRERLLGNQSKAIPFEHFKELFKYFSDEKRLQLCVLIQGIEALAESDVVKLKISDFDFEGHFLNYTRKKTKKLINVPLHPVVEKHISRWIKDNNEEIEKHDKYIFFSNAVVRSEEHISEGWLRTSVENALKELGYWKVYAKSSDNRDLHKYTDHSLRGCAATQIWKLHHDIKEVQTILGHSPKSIESTMVYIQDEEDVLFKDMMEGIEEP